MNEEEYDPQELEELISAALSEGSEKSRALFDVGGTRILSALEGILKDYLHPADRALIFNQLRDTLYDAVKSDKSDTERLKALHTIQKNCKACPQAVSDPELPKWNMKNPQVVVLTDKPLSNYGKDGIQVLVSAMKQAGFSSNRVAATSVTRCSSEGNKVDKGMVENCVSRYLFTELQLLSPDLIIACGSVAGSILASEQIKVTEKMGDIFWVGPWPVMITASPGYVLRSESKTDEFVDNFKRAYAYLNGN